MKKVLAIIIIFALSFGFLAFVDNMGGTGTASADAEETLTGTAKGFGGDINVTLVVKGDDIISVEAVGDGETPGIGSVARNTLSAFLASFFSSCMSKFHYMIPIPHPNRVPPVSSRLIPSMRLHFWN
jgi:hypothetical protein